VLSLPELRGYGNMKNLSLEMSENQSLSQASELFSLSDLYIYSIPVTDSPPGSLTNNLSAGIGDVFIQDVFLQANEINTVLSH